MNGKAEYNRCALPRLTTKLGEKDIEKWRESDRIESAKEASIEEKIRNRKKEKAEKRGETNRRMEPGQPSRKKRRTGPEDEEDRGQDEEERTQQEKGIPITSPPKKRKVNEEKERRRTPKKARHNHDIKKYITCKKWKKEKEEEEEREKESQAKEAIPPPQSNLGGKVEVEYNLGKLAKNLGEELKDRWKENNPRIEETLDRVEGWADEEMKITLLGWLAMRTDDQIEEESVEMVKALEEVAHTSNITKMGEAVMTDVVDLCRILITKGRDTLKPISPPQECSEAFAMIGLVACLVSPKKLKTSKSHQPGPVVEPLLGG